MKILIITQLPKESIEEFNERVNFCLDILNKDLRTIEDVTFSFCCYSFDTGSTIYQKQLNSVMIKYYL